MARPFDKRLFAKVERKTHRNHTYKFVLSEDAQKMWMYFLSCPRTTKCPGLIDVTVLNLMEDLGWDWRGMDNGAPHHERIMNGLKRTVAALEELAATVREEDGLPWVKWQDGDQLMFLPRAIMHNLPDNPNQITNWLLDLQEYPDTDMKREWVNLAADAFRAKYGTKDRRHVHMDRYRRSIAAKAGAHRRQACNNTEEKTELPGEPPEPLRTSPNGGSDPYEIKKEKEKKKKTLHPASGDQKPDAAKGGDTAEMVKPTEPPGDFTPRQVQFFLALQASEVYVRGKGEMMAFDAIKDPIKFARNTGADDAYPALGADEIRRACNWTLTNRTKAKVGIGRYLMNWLNRKQERGGPRQGFGGRQQEDRPNPARSDLAAKMGRTRG